MEGKFDTLSMRVTDLVPRVDRHETAISSLELKVQRLGDEAQSRDKEVVATAKALREAKEQAEATARAEAAKSDSTWQPVTKVFAVIAGLAVVWTVLQQLVPLATK
jgi:chromosome segregation ATPase